MEITAIMLVVLRIWWNMSISQWIHLEYMWTLSIYFIEQLTLVYSCTIDWIDKDLILSFIMYYFISLYLLYVHPSPPPILGFFQASIHAQRNGTLHIFPSFNKKKLLELLLLSSMIKVKICLLNISWQLRKYSL